MKTATFYPTQYGTVLTINTYKSALEIIEKGLDIRTTQMCLLNEVKDYDIIRIVSSPDDIIEIINTHDGFYDCNRTDKELRYAHNFFKLWESGVLDAA